MVTRARVRGFAIGSAVIASASAQPALAAGSVPSRSGADLTLPIAAILILVVLVGLWRVARRELRRPQPPPRRVAPPVEEPIWEPAEEPVEEPPVEPPADAPRPSRGGWADPPPGAARRPDPPPSDERP